MGGNGKEGRRERSGAWRVLGGGERLLGAGGGGIWRARWLAEVLGKLREEKEWVKIR